MSSSPTTSFRIRPRFEEVLRDDPESLRSRIVESIGRQTDHFQVKTYPGFIGIHIDGEERRRWSPQLHLSIDAAPEGGTRVIGVYGPELEYWAMYLYGYIFCGLAGLFAGIVGVVQALLDQRPWGLWIVGGLLLVCGGLYLLAQLGQKFAADQTLLLHQAYRQATGAAVD